MFGKVLIANRGVIVVRIQRTLHALGVASVVVYSEADRDQAYVREATQAVSLGDGPSSATYLNQDLILQIAKDTGAEAIHPGYGFLSENAGFIEAVENAGLAWLGPTADQVRKFGYKHTARDLAAKAGVPLVPGTGLLADLAEAKSKAEEIGYPVILKSTAGGGGIGMHICQSSADLDRSFDSVRQLSQRNFGDQNVYLEAYVSNARHIEVQIFGDGQGTVAAIGERDCSTQRRNQKVLEECPAPAISEEMRRDLHAMGVKLGKLISYRSAGTVEFIYDASRERFYFLEMNTRLQVEHGVTEMVWGVDLVEWMVKLGSGDLGSVAELAAELQPKGHAIQARLYAEDPLHDFRPSAGLVSEAALVASNAAQGVRIDTILESGNEVSALYDPMLAKFIRWAPTRDAAIDGLVEMLAESRVYGIVTNKDWLIALAGDRRFRAAEVSTKWLEQVEWEPENLVEVLNPGTFSVIQDLPGRQGYWDVGVPPSGPFDSWSFELGNRLLGNDASASGLEMTVNGAKLKFYAATQAVITGAEVPITLKGVETRSIIVGAPFDVQRGDVLEIGRSAQGSGLRFYLLVRGGFDCPLYLGSMSTFTLGQFGGHVGRTIRTGDQLRLKPVDVTAVAPATAAVRELVSITQHWDIKVLYGPHGSPDFFQADDIEMFFSHKWEVHYNSSRTGVRLIGPRPKWARADGGEAGLHPSNLHDNAYAFGAIDFTGDMPIILGPDGPSLGGFVCPAVVIKAERWKLGQLAPGNTVTFVPVSLATARALDDEKRAILSSLQPVEPVKIERDLSSPVVREVDASVGGERIVYRRAGDDFLLIEFGKMELDISLRFRAHAWMLWLRAKELEAIIDLTPGIRSLQIHYDPHALPLAKLLALLAEAEKELVHLEDLELDTREVHLPLSWDDIECQKAIDHYQKSVRPNAPWCPSNLEFIRRINGMESIDAVKKLVFGASYLVLGLGDVYLGAPVATPLDPRQRLVTTKYNPARTWTAENSVGIGGAYLCVYGMEGPGGYQFVGRTLQMWNRYRQTEFFEKPWLLRFFDQLKFYPVSHDELTQIRQDFPSGRFGLKVKPVKFKLADYLKTLEPIKDGVAEFRTQRNQAFQDEIKMWHEKGLFTFEDNDTKGDGYAANAELPEGHASIDSSVSGSIWKLLVKPGDEVKAEQPVALVESMKMEFTVVAPEAGKITSFLLKEGASVSAGQAVAVVNTK